MAVVFTVRDGHPCALDGAGLPETRLAPLDPATAAALLDAGTPNLSRADRGRVLAAAGGNPLALAELPAALDQAHSPDAASEPLPLGERLEAAFAARLAGLPAPTSSLLLLAALHDEPGLDVILAAGSTLTGRPATLDDLEPALTAGLIALDGDGLRLHHPLLRSAVFHQASRSSRAAAHRALAAALGANDERALWHRAAATTGVDDTLAAELAALGEHLAQRGDPAGATSSLERAAELTTEAARRGALFLEAAQTAHDAGRPDTAVRLVDLMDPTAVSAEHRLEAQLLHEDSNLVQWSDVSHVDAAVRLATDAADAGEVEIAVSALATTALVCFFGRPDQPMRDRVLAVLDRLPLPPDHFARLFIAGMVDPVARGIEVITQVAGASPEQVGDARANDLVGYAATGCWSPQLGLPFLTAGVEGLRRSGRLGRLTEALVGQAWAALLVGSARLSETASDEAVRLATETRDATWVACAQLALSITLADRGESARASALIEDADAAFASVQATSMMSLVALARGRAALAAGRYDEAFDQLVRIFTDDGAVHHPLIRVWGISELAEAAALSGRADEARDHLDGCRAMAARNPAPLLVFGLTAADALLADDEHAEAAFDAAVHPGSGLREWPWLRARLQLHHGVWLRRQRRTVEARTPLRAARETFEAYGQQPWADRAGAELRAAGETGAAATAVVTSITTGQLTPQELQIAQLAAEGLTNREIGQRLFLSHRTVGFHLHRLFPKLGITTRGQLAGLLRGAA